MAGVDSPIKIGSKVCKNRITMAPTVKFAAGDDGIVTDAFVKHYEERAAHGVGLIVVEATCICREGRLDPRQLGLWSENQIEGHKKLVDAVHKYGALVMPQIHHGGIGTHPECGPKASPSSITLEDGSVDKNVVELTKEDIKRIQNQFVEAAVRAKKAGYDGVQLHACHAYLINDFASNINKREDEYGGSAKNKARFGREIIEEIRKTCGNDFIISARISGADPSVAESKIVAREYVDAGCDYLQVSTGIAEFDEVPYGEELPYNRIAALGVDMHREFKGVVPVSTVNGLRNVEVVRYLIENDLVDTVDLGCGLLADPAFTEAILNDAPYVKCFSCKSCAFGPAHSHACPAMVKRGAKEFDF